MIEIGVDVEYVRADLPFCEIAETTFSPMEIEALRPATEFADRGLLQLLDSQRSLRQGAR